MLDISKIKRFLRWGDDAAEDLETAMEKQLLPESPAQPAGAADPAASEQRPALLTELAAHTCAWCEKTCQSGQDGFHLVHVAFGTTQERHCFCSDDCYEAFRRMYPSRVHRNCYETACADCPFCIKRYADESDAFPMHEPQDGTTEKG